MSENKIKTTHHFKLITPESSLEVKNMPVNVKLYRCKHKLSTDDVIEDEKNGNLIVASITIGDYHIFDDLTLPSIPTFHIQTYGGGPYDSPCGNGSCIIYAHKSSLNRLYVDKINIGDVDMNDEEDKRKHKLYKSIDDAIKHVLFDS